MDSDSILLDHGSGGKRSHQLTKKVIIPIIGGKIHAISHDGAVVDFHAGRLAFSTDTFVVDPIHFPGGSIGNLAVNGTANDIAMCGATPQYLSLSFILEEGFSLKEFKDILHDIRNAAQKANVEIVTGDTKVVGKGGCDKIFINTSGIGTVGKNIEISGQNAQIGDQIIINGSVGDHGATVLIARGNFDLSAELKSDTVCLNHLVNKVLQVSSDIHVLRDPTRGGLGTCLNEVAIESNVGIRIFENEIPIKPQVKGVCDLLGFDPVYLANEGKFIVCAPARQSEAILKVLHQDPIGAEARVIGEVTDTHPGVVLMETQIGGSRIVDMLSGEQYPRIC